jgi:putative PIN family toxin of toxin-antitoxin system
MRLAQLELMASELIEEVNKLVVLCETTPLSFSSQLRDPKDKIVLETAITIPTDVIVSGDKDLLVLQQYQNIPIVTVVQFLTVYLNKVE